jgi:4-hydroxy-tetrahydrodipicolinate synthase
MPWAYESLRHLLLGGIFVKTPLFTGAATAIVTPFRDGALDLDTLSRLIELQYAGGISAIVVCGTTGEAATLTYDEQEALYRHTVQAVHGRMKVIAGIGANDTAKALHMASLAQQAGADGLLMVTPYYNKTTQAGLLAHFTCVADHIPLPLVVYNIPSRTGIGIEPETYALLAQHPNINGVKEASGNIAAFARTMALCGDKLTFWSGNDSDTVPMMALGAKGVVSVASNLVPDVVTRLCRLCLAGDYKAAAALNAQYMDLFTALFYEVNPIPVKTALGLLGRCSSQLRLPLVPMSPANAQRLADCLLAHNLLL